MVTVFPFIGGETESGGVGDLSQSASYQGSPEFGFPVLWLMDCGYLHGADNMGRLRYDY